MTSLPPPLSHCAVPFLSNIPPLFGSLSIDTDVFTSVFLSLLIMSFLVKFNAVSAIEYKRCSELTVNKTYPIMVLTKDVYKRQGVHSSGTFSH